jgi:Zn-dependent protease with chaperone function
LSLNLWLITKKKGLVNVSKLKVTILSLLVLISTSFLSYNVVSAESTPWKWKLYTIMDIDNVSGNSAFNVPISRAAARWRATGIDLTPQYNGAYSSMNEVHVSYAPSTTNDFYGYVLVYDLAGNFLEDTSSGTAYDGKIRVYSSKIDKLTESDKTSVFLHEMGHILGLLHTSNDSVMNTGDALSLEYPTAYDKSEILKKY